MVEIRVVRVEDVEPVLALWKAAEVTESVTDGPCALRRLVDRENVAFLVAVTAGDIIGSAIGTFDGWRANVYRLAVHPAHRRKGVARGLVTALDGRFAAWGVKRVTALVEKEHPWAVQFWDATGYEHDGRIIRYVRTVPDPESA